MSMSWIFKADIETLRRLEGFTLARLVLLSTVLLTTVFLRQEVLGADIIAQIYAALSFSFLFTVLHLIYWDEVKKVRYFIASQFIYDILLTSYLVYLTGINESIFLFIYLLNIVFAALIHQTQGALSVAGMAGFFYGVIYAINATDADASNNTFYNLAYNELLLLLTALLCGQLMDELKRQKNILETHKENILRLEQLHSLLLNNIPVGVIVVDESGYVQSINRAAMQMLELKKAPEIRIKYFELLPTLKGIPENWAQIPARRKVRYQFLHSVGERAKKQFSLQVVQHPISETEGHKNRFILVLQDISKILELESKLEFESKLAATGQLAAGIAHEIRNPLASISGSIEMLNAHLKPENEEDKKLIAISLRETRRLNQLITDFLEYAKPWDDHVANFELLQKLSEVVEALQTRIKKGSKIEFKLNVPKDVYVFADPERIKQVFFNLFINTSEAAKGTTNINISAKVEQHEVVIDVVDNGPGIPANIASKIFDPFFTTKNSGTGLGLSTVAQIIKSAKGTIHLIPSESGAHFKIHLPLSDSESSLAGTA